MCHHDYDVTAPKGGRKDISRNRGGGFAGALVRLQYKAGRREVPRFQASSSADIVSMQPGGFLEFFC